ncbi:MAG TPA: biotin/lipoyl-binding protein [Candidatus Dormibacteraeota bacterium]
MALPRPIKLPPRPTGLARKNLPTAALVAVALVLAGLIGRDAIFPPSSATPVGIRTSTVSMGTVTTSVTATGTLVPAQQMNLGFKTAGTLTAVDVHVGDHVRSGQLLATIDPAPLEIALQQAQATLASAQATLSNTLSGTSLTQAQHGLDQANQNYTDAVNAANATNAADQAAAGADQTSVNSDLAQVNADKANYWYTQYGLALQSYQNQLAIHQNQWQTDLCTYNTATNPPPCAGDATAIQADQGNIACTQGTSIVGCTFEQQQMASAVKSYNADNAKFSADSAKVSADNAKTNADSASGQRSIQQAQNAVTNAQDSFNNQAVNRPATIQQQQAQIASASALVDTAQANLTAATLDAPMDGVITSLTGQAGDGVSPSTGSSGAEAPGTTAPLPSSGTGTGSTGGSAFMTLMNDKAFQTVVSFAESDAAKVASGQAGTVTFDAITGLTIPIHVLAVAGSSTVSSNVVNYYVTLTLDSLDDRLKPGLTTNATVITARAANVLVVPNAAITHRGTTATVTVLQGSKEVVTDVETGIAGSGTTEIISGLKAGDKVVLPTTATRTTTTGTGAGGRGLGGGGGGGGAGLGLGG